MDAILNDPSTSEASAEPRTFKVVLVGEGAVGKTSILLRYIENKFNPKHLSTLQASFFTKKLSLAGRRAQLNIWDTAGQERFHALGPIYYRDSSGALLVFDITDAQSFDKMQMWVKELRRELGDSCTLMIVGNKSDLAGQRQITTQQAHEYANAVRALYRESSAKHNENMNIENIFIELTKAMLDRPPPVDESSGARGNRNLLLVDNDDGQAATARKKCCR